MLKKKWNKNHLQDDARVSELPDETLVSIFCHLPMQGAMRTSVLSGWWKNLWTMVPKLVFDTGGISRRI